MAAVETLRRGYQRYVIGATHARNEFSVDRVTPATEMHVVMLNPGDQGYENGLDAKSMLGEDWEKKVENGISTC
jgi:hypothetical protein